MQTTIRLNSNELTMEFLEGLKKMFKGKEITLTIETEMDETEFLMSYPKNKNKLLKALKNANEGRLITVNMDDINPEKKNPVIISALK
jgi:hypothetical protein